jgi:hypothetical protein
MAIKKSEIARILEGIAERLEEVVNITSTFDVNELTGFETGDYDSFLDDNSDEIESTELISENRIEDITEILSREIDTIIRLVDVIE